MADDHTLKARLTEGSVKGQLTRMTLPMVGGIFAMMAFNLTDTYFVSRLGTEELAAMTFTFPVVMLFFSMSIGLGAGTSSVLARALGGESDRSIRRIATDSLLLSVLVVGAFSAIGLLLCDPIFRLLGADEVTLPLVREYMILWFSGAILVIVPMVANSAIRATGNTKLPSLFMVAASIINIALDPILIFGLLGFPALGLKGAAIATLASRSITLVLGIWVLWRVERLLTFEVPSLPELITSWKRILHIGLPAAATNMIIPGTMTVITPMIAAFGAQAVAAFGAASRIQSMALILFFAISAVIGPFVGQNQGAAMYDRIREAVRVTYVFCFAFGAVAAIALMLAARPLAAIFSQDPEVIDIAVRYLMIMPIGFGLYGIVMQANAIFNALDRPLRATVLSVTRMVGLFLPLAWIGSEVFGLHGIWIGGATANVLAGILALVLTRAMVKDDALAAVGAPAQAPPAPHRRAAVGQQ